MTQTDDDDAGPETPLTLTTGAGLDRVVTNATGGRGRDRVQPVDGLRFIAAVMVVLYHLTFFGFAANRLSPVGFDGLSTLSRYGGLGVNLFFIISGFVIPMTAQGRTPWQFVVSRIVRLFPAYWVCCTVTYLGLLFLPHHEFHVSFAQYLVNLTMIGPLAGFDFVDGVYWSLIVELKFYFLVFLLLTFGLLRHARAFLGVWLAVSWLAQHHIAATHVTDLLLLTDWSGYFIAGATFSLVRQRQRWDWYSAGLVGLSCLMVVQQAVAAAAEESRLLGATEHGWVVAGALVIFFVLFALIASGRIGRVSSPALVLAGGLTYPLYLLHQRLGYTVFEHAGASVNRYALLALLIGGALALAYVVHRGLERPIQRRLRSFLVTPLDRPVPDAI